MKINIIGGGPAGMYLAILMKKSDPDREITIYERNGPDDTFGWGVVFSGKTLRNLEAADPESHAEITRVFEAWENVDVVHGDERISVHGNSFSGVGRLKLLKVLQKRCEQLGIVLLFHTEITDVEDLRSRSDLLVGADGVNSTVRKLYAERFEPNLDVRPNRYIWYGTNKLFHGLTLTFRENQDGAFAAHSYKFNRTTSTFIIECDEETWTKAGFASLDDDATRNYLQEVFEKDLNGQPLLTNNSKWINFLLVKNANWWFENVVLLGDSLHTAHFSIGSGTKLAIEDAIALHESIEKAGGIAEGLRKFESVRRPIIEDYQAAAFESMRWFENARSYLHLRPIELAYSLMTRSGRVDEQELRKRDPGFVSAYERSTNRCFASGTLVKTKSGWKPIESIAKHDLVWTGNGRWQAVIAVQARPHVGRLRGIKLRNHTATVWVTPEHRFLTPSPQAERGNGGEEGQAPNPTPYPSPLAGRGKDDRRMIHRRLGGLNKRSTHLARELRERATSVESLLWEELRGRRLGGAKFRRQHPIGANYIVDFYCAQFHLAIELDSAVHDGDRQRWADGIRQRQIQVAGIRILRFQNDRILNDLTGVLEEINEFINGRLTSNLEAWVSADNLEVDDTIVLCESGDLGAIESIQDRFVNQTVYDLTIEGDHSFITEIGVAHNCGE